MGADYHELFSVLDDIGARLDHLTRLTKEKHDAVVADDVTKVNEIMNEEQAEALAFRNLERRRETALQALGLSGTSLSALPTHCPPELRTEAEQRVAVLQEKFRTYRTSSTQVMELMQHSIREIDAVVSSAGGEPVTGPGYAGETAAPPPNMKTDFRA